MSLWLNFSEERAGRPFEEDTVYLAAVSNYLLGNTRCGLRGFSAEDVLWAQREGNDETAQSLIAGYLLARGTVTPADFGWSWNITWSGSLEDATLPEEQTGAKLADIPRDGQSVVIYQEPEQAVLTDQANNDGLAAVSWEASGPALTGPRPEGAVVFTVQAEEDGTYRFLDGEGRWLAAGASGGLTLTREPASRELCSWRLEPAYGGWYVLNAGAAGNQALQRYGSRITTYSFSGGSLFIFNFYQPTGL